ncbi:SUZ domain-containing protein 1 [Frankliniella occidentalis]|uniref:SUZ RNA-binding domain-containing n=1 Tax=Frankliniella occidentalis TaxID=133901 RepID=A0A6J1T4J4_FRAOC|nr:SUZ domain-containing protein 1 [Frankliniella occidentalis]
MCMPEYFSLTTGCSTDDGRDMASEELEIFDSWEEMDDSEVLERKLKLLNVPTMEDSSIKRGNSDQPASRGVILTGDDAFRTQYAPPEPTVKILKRPTQNSNGGGDGPSMNGENKPSKQPIKTLQQREQEYAQARLRILGEARSPEEIVEDKINKIQAKVEVLRPPEMDCIIRLPKGPDGTRGFHIRR